MASGGMVNVDDKSPVSQNFDAVFGGSPLNSSNWTVATSGARASGTADTGGVSPWLLAAAAGVVVLLVVKRMKRGK